MIFKSLKDYEWPEKCCKNIKQIGFKSCGKIATSWFIHNKDICSYCDEHYYICGEKISKEEFEKLKYE